MPGRGLSGDNLDTYQLILGEDDGHTSTAVWLESPSNPFQVSHAIVGRACFAEAIPSCQEMVRWMEKTDLSTSRVILGSVTSTTHTSTNPISKLHTTIRNAHASHRHPHPRPSFPPAP